MAAETIAKAPLHQRAAREMKEFLILTAYLYVTLGAVIVMKQAVMYTNGVNGVVWGTAIIKALLLAKFMLVGKAMKVGERRSAAPLIWPTLRKSFAFLVLLVVLTIVEEVIVGLFHHQSVAAALGDLFGPHLAETAAGIIILLLVLIPYFAYGVLDEALGEGRLARMFFVAREPAERAP